LLPARNAKQAAADFPGWRVRDHGSRPQPAWTAGELGCIKPSDGDAVSDARLACIAARGSDGWQVTEATIATARALRLTADQILGWLHEQVAPPIPPLLEMAIRNWSGRETCRLARVHLLQVSRPQARDAILHSPAFAPLLAGHIAPDWFVLRDDCVKRHASADDGQRQGGPETPKRRECISIRRWSALPGQEPPLRFVTSEIRDGGR